MKLKLSFALVLVIAASAVTVVALAQSPTRAEAAASSGSCQDGWLSTNRLDVSSGGGVIRYNVTMKNYWWVMGMSRSGAATGRFVQVRSFWPDRVVQQKTITWYNGNASFSGQVYYNSLGFKSGQTVTFKASANGPGNQSGKSAVTCGVTITLQ